VDSGAGEEFSIEELRRRFDRSMSAEDLASTDFRSSEESSLYALKLYIDQRGVTADRLREEWERLDPEDPLRTWLAVGVAYGAGLDAEDAQWAAQQALMGPLWQEELTIPALAGLHALDLMARRLDQATLVPGIVATLLGQNAEGPADPAAGKPRAQRLQLALGLALELDPSEIRELGDFRAGLRENLASEQVPADLRAQAYGLLAQAGDPQDVQFLLTELAGQVPGAEQALSYLRAPELALDLQRLIATAGDSPAGQPLAARALTGLLRSDAELALKTLRAWPNPESPASAVVWTEAFAGLGGELDLALFHRLHHELNAVPGSLGEAWQEHHQRIVWATVKKSWIPLTRQQRRKSCERLQEIIEFLPLDSPIRREAFADLSHIADAEVAAYIRARVDLNDPDHHFIRDLLEGL
jgi:hypothetical protein